MDFLLLGHPGFQLFFISLGLFLFLFQFFLAYFFDVGDTIAPDFPVFGLFFFRCSCSSSRFSSCRLRGGLAFRHHFDGTDALSFLGNGLMISQFHFLAVGDFCGVDRGGHGQGSQDGDGQLPPVYMFFHRVPPIQVVYHRLSDLLTINYIISRLLYLLWTKISSPGV